MKPLNADSQGCDPISSNCVIWQGPTIDCIKLCKGDTVSDVVFKLATELCDILETLDITNYDLSCFNLTTCKPEDFQALIQFLIKRICALEKCTGCIPDCNGNETMTPSTPVSGCPDCIVSIAPCFYFNNEFGDQVTQMQLSDYVHAIGNKICDIISRLDTIEATLVQYNERITALEIVPPPVFIEPTVIPVGDLPPVPTPLSAVVISNNRSITSLRSATGTPDQLYQSIIEQCDALNNSLALGPIGGLMGGITGWVNSPSNVADTITNIWLTICDLRAAVRNIQINCCSDGCSDIIIDMQLLLTGNTLKIFFTGTIPAGFQNCAPGGSMFTITDTSGGLINIFIDVVAYMNNINGYIVDLTSSVLNTLNNLTVVGTPCFHNNVTDATCQFCLERTFYNTAICPDLTLTPSSTGISYSAPVNAGTATYTIQVYDAAGTTLITSSSQTITGPGIFSGIINGLLSGTLYKVKLVITVGTVTTECAFQNVTTFGLSCLAPSDVVASFEGTGEAPIIDLVDARTFSVLAGTTATTVGATTVNGDLGTSPGAAIVGGWVVGGVIGANTAEAIAAQASLTAAYLAAEAVTGATDLSSVSLNGLTLTPGVYKFTSSALLEGTLTLSGDGNYIFQVGSTLTTGSGAIVNLTNGAQVRRGSGPTGSHGGIFWQVGSSATFGAGTDFAGNVLILTSATLNGATNIDGAVLAINGAVTASGPASNITTPL